MGSDGRRLEDGAEVRDCDLFAFVLDENNLLILIGYLGYRSRRGGIILGKKGVYVDKVGRMCFIEDFMTLSGVFGLLVGG
jgi:hypothetical protein